MPLTDLRPTMPLSGFCVTMTRFAAHVVTAHLASTFRFICRAAQGRPRPDGDPAVDVRNGDALRAYQRGANGGSVP
jgi:hypothetical protein